jgi:hypothetical protein
MSLVELDELSAHRWLKEAKSDFHKYQERYRNTGSNQDKFDLLLKYLEITYVQAEKNNLKNDTS